MVCISCTKSTWGPKGPRLLYYSNAMGNTVNIFPTSFEHGFLTRDYIKDYFRRAYMTVLRLCDGSQYSCAKAMGMILYGGFPKFGVPYWGGSL